MLWDKLWLLFFESYKKKWDKIDRLVQLHSGWYTKRIADVTNSLTISRRTTVPPSEHGKSFASFQDGLERIAGIINSPLYFFLQIPLAVLNIIIKVVDGMCELINGEFKQFGKRFLSIVDDVGKIIAAPLLAVMSLLGNMADVGFGVISTLNDSASSSLRMS